ncbi:MAG TPA: protoporphyrinogen oxidase [Gemmataceae bacterium]|nr:protoporphyrinogen oxidase [Gemmataceae bacterium]
MPNVLILGAGISGLTVAYRLQQTRPDIDITILEPCDRPGGTIWTERRDGFQIEIGPNGFLDTKPTTFELCRDLGLAGSLVTASDAAAKNRFLFVDGQLKALPNGLLPFLKTNLLSWRGKLSFLMERFRAPRLDPSDESVDAFAARRAGREVADVFADALVTGIHAGDPRLLSIRAAFPRIAGLEREFGSVIKGLGRTAKQRRAEAKARGEVYQRPGKMWSFRDGLRLLVETLSTQLKQQPLLGVEVRRIARSDGSGKPQWIASASAVNSWTADAVVLACPAHQQARLLGDIDTELSEKIAAIPYNRVAVVALGYRRADVPMSVDGFGYIAPQRTRRDLLGVQWCSSIFPGRAPEGTVLLRAMCGGWHRAEIVGWDDGRLLQAARAELQLAMGVAAEPIFHHIVRWDRAIPQYHLGHLERVAEIESRVAQHPGLFLTGNAYHGVAMNDCTEQGMAVALKVSRYLAGAEG